jgi:hypothetical protein
MLTRKWLDKIEANPRSTYSPARSISSRMT